MPKPRAIDTCREVIGLLTEYMEGGLPGERARALEAHLDLCPACKGFLATLKTTSGAVRNLRCDELPEECHELLRGFLDRAAKVDKA